ncbi:hypothetical protein [Ligilactobacillus acidipiscis]|uniref:hypothetical protein n=1 Tax=Ligilactobacillus acidipiscis TaxID=89059 RepID=UPI0022E89EF5|nr:hypothetical protein [Ligilactobacillus acidipiscis]
MPQIKYEDKTELVLFLSLKQEHYFDVINYVYPLTKIQMLLNVNEDTGLWFEMSRKALNVVDDDSPVQQFMKNYATNMLTSIKNIIGPDFAKGSYWKDFYIHIGSSRTSPIRIDMDYGE